MVHRLACRQNTHTLNFKKQVSLLKCFLASSFIGHLVSSPVFHLQIRKMQLFRKFLFNLFVRTRTLVQAHSQGTYVDVSLFSFQCLRPGVGIKLRS